MTSGGSIGGAVGAIAPLDWSKGKFFVDQFLPNSVMKQHSSFCLVLDSLEE